MQPRDIRDIQYLAFEGGGGKAIAYLGALRVLEELGLLPYCAPRDPKGLLGVSGTSGGAITAFLIALGLNAKQIEETSGSGDFDSFYDPPERGFCKAVVYDPKTQRNRSGYTVSIMRPGPPKNRIYEVHDGSLFFEDIEEARSRGNTMARLRQSRSPITAAITQTWLYGAVPAFDLLTKDDNLAPIAAKVLKNPVTTIRYMHSFFYDRGVFAGIGARTYFMKQLVKWAKATYQKTLTLAEAQNLTFREFYEFTGLIFSVIGTNITTEKPKEFSRSSTPDFPVVDAVCLSMAIPGAFRPTFVNCHVDLERYRSGTEVDLAYLRDYMGFYADGGTTNNFPIHNFDTDGTLNRAVLGIRSTGGEDLSFLADYKTTDDMYLRYVNLRTSGNTKKEIEKVRYRDDGLLVYTWRQGPLATVLELLGKLYNTIMYYTEEGQVRTESERDSIIELFSYDVGLFDFDLSKDNALKALSLFVQRTAAVKLASQMGLFPPGVDTYAKMIRSRSDAVHDSQTPEQRVASMLYEHYDISRAPMGRGTR